MPDEDLRLQLKIVKDQARREIAEFGAEVKAQTAQDLSEVQRAEDAKVEAARSAAARRAAATTEARKTETGVTIAEEQTQVSAVLAEESRKVAVLKAADAERRASIRETWLAQTAATADSVRQTQGVLVLANQMHREIAALESGANRTRIEQHSAETQQAQAVEQSKIGGIQRLEAARQSTLATTRAAQKQQAAEAISSGREIMLAAGQNQQRLAAIESQTGQAQQDRFMATRSAMEIEIGGVDQLGQAYVRVRMAQQTQTQGAAQAAAGIASGLAPGNAAVNTTAGSVGNLGKMFLKLQVVNQVAGWIREGMQAVGQSVQAVREHIKGLVSEMEAARTGAKELAALRGEGATGAFTAQLAREAAGAGLDAEDYKQFQLGFQAQAGQYVGKSEATPEQLAEGGQKINKEQADELQKRVASYSMGARGLSAEDSSRLLGTVIAKSKAGASNDNIMSEYAKLMKVMELAPGRTSPLLGQLSELGMESVGESGDFKNLQQAGYLIRVMAQRNPQEASTYGRAVLRGLRDLQIDKKGKGEKSKELGITDDMDVMQQLQQIDIKAQEHVAKGGKEGEFIQRYFPEIREFGGVRTALNEGLRGGGFQRAEAEAATVNEGTAQAETNRYLGGREGVAARQRSELLATKRESASFYEPLRQRQANAAIALAGSHDLEIPENMMNAVLTNAGSAFGQGSRETQQINKITAKDLTQGLHGYKEGREFLTQKYGHDVMGGGRREGEISGTAPERDLAEAARLLERLAKAAEAKRDHPGQHVPLVNPPQARGGARH